MVRPAVVAILGAALCALGEPAQSGARMIIMGVDGMDPVMLGELIAKDRTPKLAKLASMGGFIPLGTSIPPQSPVAWSNFITGMDPGGHGIFDFLHLERDTLIPYLSTARVAKGQRELKLGRVRIPLSPQKTLQLRDGLAFWEVLERNGIPTTMFQIPANYPPIETGGYALSGMGTPDLQGTPGTFSYYTDSPRFKPGKVPGGVIKRIKLKHGVVETVIEGPPNAFLKDSPKAKVDLRAYVDPENPVAMLEAGEEQVLLNVGEWSEWVGLEFELLPKLVRVSGMVRFFLQQTKPHFALYVSPVNIDPRDPAQPIATPAEYAYELAEAAGPFYTQEMPESTKALSAHVLSPREFIAQSELVLDERRRLFRRELDRFRRADGLLFFYFSSIDQRHHMLYRQMDPKHPFHAKDTPADLGGAMPKTYEEIDQIVGWALEELDGNTMLIVMSDHGFAPFRRQANLNTWLEQHGYLKLKDSYNRDLYDWLQGIDWSKTRAFAIGLNSLYINVRGRERYGIVDPDGRAALAHEIAKGLEAWKDQQTGGTVISQVALREDVYHGPHVDAAPDILVGYARGYRASWATTSGKIPLALIDDNDREWSGDHCIDSREVPGVLLSNRTLKAKQGELRDLTVSVLAYFGIRAPSQMRGRPLF
ncbi:MAG: alkaline phosphatase family protein [Gammaproteobacteria bacterium]